MIPVIGYIAGTLNTLCFLPQVIQIWRTKDTKSLSLTMYVAFTTGTILWLIYGFALGLVPVCIANVISLVLLLSIVFLKIKHG